MKGLKDAAQGLLTKAKHDLHAADTVLPTNEALDVVLFHAQQAVEKSLKSLLILKGINYPLTHDVDELLELALPDYPQLGVFAPETDLLGTYSVAGRYDHQVYPSLEEARAGLALAHRVYEYAIQQL